MEAALEIAPGVTLRRGRLDRAAQQALLDDVLARAAPFYRPVMPGSGKPFSVEETNLGSLGWISGKDGYRYTPTDPATGAPWRRSRRR